MAKCSHCGEDQSICGSREDHSIHPPGYMLGRACDTIAQLKKARGTELDLVRVLALSDVERFGAADLHDCSPKLVGKLWKTFSQVVRNRILHERPS